MRRVAGPDERGGGPPTGDGAVERVEDLLEHAPCGILSTLPDGRIVTVNATLLGWLGRRREAGVRRRRVAALLTGGGRS